MYPGLHGARSVVNNFLFLKDQKEVLKSILTAPEEFLTTMTVRLTDCWNVMPFILVQLQRSV